MCLFIYVIKVKTIPIYSKLRFFCIRLIFYALFSAIVVFIASDLSKSRQKLVSNFEMIVGNLAPKSIKTIRLNVLSLIDGTIELEQTVGYQIANDHDRFKAAESVKHELNPKLSSQQKESHNVTLQYVDDAVIKSKKDIIIVQCATEFICTGRFLTLNKNALTQAIKYEDFFLQIELEIKSTDIEILDIFLISVRRTKS